MKTKQMTKYIIETGLRYMAIYYAIVLAVLLLITIISRSSMATGMVGIGNSSLIFLFVIGIVFFSMFLKSGFSYSISRKTMYLSMLLSGTVFAAVTGIGDSLMSLLLKLLSGSDSDITYSYSLFFENAGALSTVLATVCYYLCSALIALTLGYFIGGLYYRMGKALKVIVSVCVPLVFFVGLPIAIVYLPDLMAKLFGWVGRILEFGAVTPFNMSLLCLIATLILSGFLWLLIRRAPVKEK